MIRRKCELSSIPTSAKPRWGVETRPPGSNFDLRWGVGKMRWGGEPPTPPANRTLIIYCIYCIRLPVVLRRVNSDTVNYCGRERLRVVVDLKRRYTNIRID